MAVNIIYLIEWSVLYVLSNEETLRITTLTFYDERPLTTGARFQSTVVIHPPRRPCHVMAKNSKEMKIGHL